MKTSESLATTISILKARRNITSAELASRAGVPQSLVSGLLHGNRVIGEYAARKIGKVLQLHGEELEGFVYQAIDNCSEKVLQQSKNYPSELLNLIACELQTLGILPERISRCIRKSKAGNAEAALYLNDGQEALIRLEVAYR